MQDQSAETVATVSHTPGPWRFVEPVAIDWRDPQIESVEPRSRVAISCGGGPDRAVSGAEQRANARLMAAAPDLLAAAQKGFSLLNALLDFYGQNLQVHGWHANGAPEPFDNFIDENSDGTELAALHDAIIRATGGQP
jgi:hypothetical protein